MSKGLHYRLAETIWNMSRADEGTISATGANIIADALLPLVAAECSDAARQAAEEALATAADEFEIPTPTRYGVRKWLRDRAARIARAGGEER